jgi:hypothetical protein
MAGIGKEVPAGEVFHRCLDGNGIAGWQAFRLEMFIQAEPMMVMNRLGMQVCMPLFCRAGVEVIDLPDDGVPVHPDIKEKLDGKKNRAKRNERRFNEQIV